MLEQLKDLLKHKKSNSYYAEKLGTTEEEIKKMKKQIKKVVDNEQVIENFAEVVKKVNNEKGTLESSVETTYEPKNDIELAELHKIDLTKYKISTYWSKLKSNGKFTSSVLASLKKPQDYTAEDFAKFLEKYEPKTELYQFHVTGGKNEYVDIEVNIADFHLAKKTLEGDTIQDKKNHYIKIVKELTDNVLKVYNIRKIVFPISNDFFHTDNIQNQTTAGTPQDVLVEYDNEYEEGFDLLIHTIGYLRTLCDEVEVVLVQGNHDRTKSFYLAHALDIFFKYDAHINFQREHSTTKSVVLGCTFIGYHHGNCKIDDLPLLFATGKDSIEFGKASYREVHTGDKHFYMAKEFKGVRIQQVCSLSGTDRWHQDNNYVHNVRAGLLFVYHPTKGKIAEFESRI